MAKIPQPYRLDWNPITGVEDVNNRMAQLCEKADAMFQTLFDHQAISKINVSASNSSKDLSNLVFSNSNGVSFGLSGSTLTASVGVGYAGLGETVTTTTGTGLKLTVNSDGVSIAHPAWLTTAALSNHSHGNPTLALTNLTGTTASASNGFTLSLSAAAAGAAGGGTLSGLEPFPIFNANTANSSGIENGSWNLYPFVNPCNLVSGRINFIDSHDDSNVAVLRATSAGSSFVSGTTGTRSVHYEANRSVALYSRGAGAASTELQSFWSNTWNVSIDQSVSVLLTNATHVSAGISVTVSYPVSVGSDGAYTTASFSATAARSSASINMATSAFTSALTSVFNLLTGRILIPFGFNTSLSPGLYYLGHAISTNKTTGGTNIQDQWPIVNHFCLNVVTTMQARLFGNSASTGRSEYFPGFGMYTTESSIPPATIQFSHIKQTSNQFVQYFNFINIPADPQIT